MSDFQTMHWHQSGYTDRAAAARRVHQRVMAAMAWPGARQQLPLPDDVPDGLPPVAAALLLALCDSDTPVYLPESLRASRWCATWLRLHCQAAVDDDCAASRFAVGRLGEDLPLGRNVLTRKLHDAQPDLTLLLEVASLRRGLPIRLRSSQPARRDVIVDIDGLPADVLGSRCRQDAHRPLGVDIIVFDADSIVALPRGTRLAVALEPLMARSLPGALPA